MVSYLPWLLSIMSDLSITWFAGRMISKYCLLLSVWWFGAMLRDKCSQ